MSVSSPTIRSLSVPIKVSHRGGVCLVGPGEGIQVSVTGVIIGSGDMNSTLPPSYTVLQYP